MISTTTEESKFTFLQVLKIKNADLWEAQLNHYRFVHKGDLQVLFSESLNTVILRTSDHSWILEKDLQITGTRNKAFGWQCYAIPAPGGFFLLKITQLQFEGEEHPELTNLETIFENFANFKRVNSLELHFNNFVQTPTSGLSDIKGSITKVMGKFQDKLFHSDTSNHPNNKIVRPLNELLAVNTDGVPMVDVAESQINGLRGEMSLLTRDYQSIGVWSQIWEGQVTDLSSNVESLDLNAGEKQNQGQQSVDTGSNLTSNLSASGNLNQGQQQSLGDSSERLPSYEVHQTSEQVHQGLKQASSNLGDSALPTESLKEDTEFTTGLLKDDIKPSPETPYHKNEQQNPPVELKPTEVKKDLPKASLQMQSWGSNVTNPSETNPTLDLDTGKSKPEVSTKPSEQRLNLDKITEQSGEIDERETAGAI